MTESSPLIGMVCRYRWSRRYQAARHPLAALRERWQVQIRCCSMAGWVVEHLDARSDVYAAARRGQRAARRLCLVSGVALSRADAVARAVLDHWQTSSALLSGADLRAAMSDTPRVGEHN